MAPYFEPEFDARQAGERDDRPAHPAVGDEQVAAAAEDAKRQAEAPEEAERLGQLVRVGGLDVELGRPPEAPRGQRRQRLLRGAEPPKAP
jgi:hypothetical protein